MHLVIVDLSIKDLQHEGHPSTPLRAGSTAGAQVTTLLP